MNYTASSFFKLHSRTSCCNFSQTKPHWMNGALPTELPTHHPTIIHTAAGWGKSISNWWQRLALKLKSKVESPPYTDKLWTNDSKTVKLCGQSAGVKVALVILITEQKILGLIPPPFCYWLAVLGALCWHSLCYMHKSFLVPHFEEYLRLNSHLVVLSRDSLSAAICFANKFQWMSMAIVYTRTIWRVERNHL